MLRTIQASLEITFCGLLQYKLLNFACQYIVRSISLHKSDKQKSCLEANFEFGYGSCQIFQWQHVYPVLRRNGP